MLQQPSRDEWPGQRGTRRPAKRCQGHCLCRVCGVAHEGLRAAVPTDGTTDAWTTAALVVRAGSVLGCPGRPWRSRRVVLGTGAQAHKPVLIILVAFVRVA